MAYTAGTGFRYWKSLGGNMAAPTPVQIRIANSTTLRIGDMVRVNTAGFLVASGASNPIAGVLVGFVNKSGINPFSLGFPTASGATLTGDDTLATASDNQTATDDYIYGEVIVDPAGDILWLNDASADLAQTNLFQFFDLDSNSRQADQATVSDSAGQVQLIAWDPEGSSVFGDNVKTADASKGAFRIARNQYGNLVDSATAKVAA